MRLGCARVRGFARSAKTMNPDPGRAHFGIRVATLVSRGAKNSKTVATLSPKRHQKQTKNDEGANPHPKKDFPVLAPVFIISKP